jgi:hypothetical protein
MSDKKMPSEPESGAQIPAGIPKDAVRVDKIVRKGDYAFIRKANVWRPEDIDAFVAIVKDVAFNEDLSLKSIDIAIEQQNVRYPGDKFGDKSHTWYSYKYYHSQYGHYITRKECEDRYQHFRFGEGTGRYSISYYRKNELSFSIKKDFEVKLSTV